MTDLEAMTRARDAIIEAVRPLTARPAVADLVALAEATGGLCPRKGRALIGVLVREGVLSRAPGGVLVSGPFHRSASVE